MLLHIAIENWFWLVISILMVWRIATFICFEAGPFDFMTYIRILLYKIKLGKIIECFHCTSVWISFIITLLIYNINVYSFFIAIAIAGGASIIERILNHQTNNSYTNEDD